NVARTWCAASTSRNSGVEAGSGPSSNVSATWSGSPMPDRPGRNRRRTAGTVATAGSHWTAATTVAPAPAQPAHRPHPVTAHPWSPARPRSPVRLADGDAGPYLAASLVTDPTPVTGPTPPASPAAGTAPRPGRAAG